ncbi:MAG: hypothetical protein QW227_01180 [Candidatus Aenigmatarchaeota archaeon]|nr:hypothetical protein [Candidatus Aenigmarchaeota archaeon]
MISIIKYNSCILERQVGTKEAEDALIKTAVKYGLPVDFVECKEVDLTEFGNPDDSYNVVKRECLIYKMGNMNVALMTNRYPGDSENSGPGYVEAIAAIPPSEDAENFLQEYGETVSAYGTNESVDGRRAAEDLGKLLLDVLV